VGPTKGAASTPDSIRWKKRSHFLVYVCYVSKELHTGLAMRTERSAVIKKQHIVVLVALLSILFFIGGYLYYRSQVEEGRLKAHQVLFTTGMLKANQLAVWYKDELYDASVFSHNPLLKNLIGNWFVTGRESDKSHITDLLVLTQDSHSYENILLTDHHGRLVLSLDQDVEEIESILLDHIRRAVNTREIISTDLYKSSVDQRIYFDVLAPILNEHDEPIAVLVWRLDPHEYLYPFIRSWPTQSKTGETFIVREEDDGVLYLNELRHRTDTALTLRFPLTRESIPSVQAVLGYKGIVDGKDYRGVDVLSDFHKVPGTPWFIVAKIDKSEIYSDLYSKAGTIFAFVLLLTLLSAAGLAFIYSHRQRNIYQELYNAERELWQSQEEFRTTLYSIGDAVITTDAAGTIQSMNSTAERLTGWVEADARGNPIERIYTILNEETRRSIDNPVQKVLREGLVVGLANHAVLISKEGKEFPIADNGAPIRNKAGEITGVVLVFRDQSPERDAARQLRESERRLSTLMSNLPGMAYRCSNDPQWTMEFISEGCIDLTGYSRDELEGNRVFAYADLIHPDDQKMIWDEVQNALSSNRPFELTYRIRTAQGIEKRVWEQGTGIYNDSGDVAALEGFIIDITEREQMQDRILLQATALESAANAIMITDRDGKIQWVNPSFERITGYSTEETIGEQTRLLKSGKHDTAFYRDLWETVLSGKVWHGEMTNRRKDGSYYYEEQTITPVKNESGEITHFVSIKQDITTRKQAEEELRRREQQFRLITENVPDMIVVLDTEGKRLYNSPSYEPLLGDPVSLAGTDSFQDIHPDDRERIKRIFYETVKTGNGHQTEYRLLSKDGSICIVESRGGVIRDEQGNVSQVVVVSRDITEKRRLEQQLLRTQRMESIGTLAGGIAHDLNNVLAPILLSLNIIKRKVADPKTEKLIETIESTAKRGSDLVKQILSFARGMEGERTQVKLGILIDDVVKVLKQTFPKSIRLKTDTPKNLWTMSADATQIHQVLMNLCINARDAMPDGGHLEIKADNTVIDTQYAKMNLEAKPGYFVRISVSDTGSGVPHRILDRIFEPFFTTKEHGKGTGLGLSTVHTIVKSHGGFVNVYSEEGKGTVFNVYFPAAGTGGGDITEEKNELPAGSGELILVVDDEEAIRAITETTLEANGYRVITASDGREAIAMYTEYRRHIALVLMDLKMPNMDGSDAIRSIKKINPSARLIAMSGLVQDGQSTEKEFVGFLHKPFTAQTLLLSIYEMIGK
jgi:two-component system, cell cycle sensor histidine kinase and response regulator CckA